MRGVLGIGLDWIGWDGMGWDGIGLVVAPDAADNAR